MCDAPATGGEHVPPKCIFPEESRFRRDLIKVPSCDRHNSHKSKCDEYLKFVLTAAGGMNELALGIFGGSVMRSFDHVPHLVEKFTPDLQRVKLGDLETAGFKLDVPRFEHSITSIVRGLFFKMTGKKLVTGLRVAWAHMLLGDYSKAPFVDPILAAERRLPANYLGTNPRVFQYAFNTSKTGKKAMCRLRFYEGLPVCALWDIENSAEIDALIARQMHSTEGDVQ